MVSVGEERLAAVQTAADSSSYRVAEDVGENRRALPDSAD